MQHLVSQLIELEESVKLWCVCSLILFSAWNVIIVSCQRSYAKCTGQSYGHYGFTQNAWDNLADIMASCKLHGTISRTLWLHANCMEQFRRHYGFMQIAWDNFADITASCKMHGTISRTLWLHAKCMGQSRGHSGFMQNAWDNLADITTPCKFIALSNKNRA